MGNGPERHFCDDSAPIRRRGIKRRRLCRADSAGVGHWLDDCDVAQ